VEIVVVAVLYCSCCCYSTNSSGRSRIRNDVMNSVVYDGFDIGNDDTNNLTWLTVRYSR